MIGKIDPPGTCHLVSCPDKGKHPPHLIGTSDTFEPYQAPKEPAKVLLEQADVALLLDVAGEWQTHKHREALHRVSRALAVARNS